jgi:hypothetical protein
MERAGESDPNIAARLWSGLIVSISVGRGVDRACRDLCVGGGAR